MPVRHTIVVGSGKGGVGKSTVALNLALALAQRDAAVGLLDADVHGPSIALMVGIARTEWTRQWHVYRAGRPQAISPVDRHGLKIMSLGFVLGEDQPMGLPEAALDVIVRQLVEQVEWGDLDYLVVDLPPGTTQIQNVIFATTDVSGAILVVTPQDVTHIDGKKAVAMYRAANVPLLGAVENMAGVRCPDCGKLISLFSPVSPKRSVWAMGVERLISLETDAAIAASGDGRTPVVCASPDSHSAGRFLTLAATVVRRLAEGEGMRQAH